MSIQKTRKRQLLFSFKTVIKTDKGLLELYNMLRNLGIDLGDEGIAKAVIMAGAGWRIISLYQMGFITKIGSWKDRMIARYQELQWKTDIRKDIDGIFDTMRLAGCNIEEVKKDLNEIGISLEDKTVRGVLRNYPELLFEMMILQQSGILNSILELKRLIRKQLQIREKINKRIR